MDLNLDVQTQADQVWIFVGALLVVAEVFSGRLRLVALGLGCAAAAAVAFSGGGIGLQFGVFAAFSAGLFGVLRITLGSRADRDQRKRLKEAARQVNREVDVLEAIGPGAQPGVVWMDGERWPAIGNGELLAAGARARITGVDERGLRVRPATGLTPGPSGLKPTA